MQCTQVITFLAEYNIIAIRNYIGCPYRIELTALGVDYARQVLSEIRARKTFLEKTLV
ncbi:MAG: hypothetical protein V1915_03795 [Candidatus Bathyarchaeota archaeon]